MTGVLKEDRIEKKRPEGNDRGEKQRTKKTTQKKKKKRNREAEIKTGRQSEERKERIQKPPRRRSSVGTAFPHCHLRLQLQRRGTVEPLSKPQYS